MTSHHITSHLIISHHITQSTYKTIVSSILFIYFTVAHSIDISVSSFQPSACMLTLYDTDAVCSAGVGSVVALHNGHNGWPSDAELASLAGLILAAGFPIEISKYRNQNLDSATKQRKLRGVRWHVRTGRTWHPEWTATLCLLDGALTDLWQQHISSSHFNHTHAHTVTSIFYMHFLLSSFISVRALVCRRCTWTGQTYVTLFYSSLRWKSKTDGWFLFTVSNTIVL